MVQSLVEQDGSASNETIARELHAKFKARKVQMRTLNVNHVVPQDSTASQNAQAWFEAETLEDGRGKVSDVSLIVDGLYFIDGLYGSLSALIRFRPSAKPVSPLRLRRPQRSRHWISVFLKWIFPVFWCTCI